MRRRLPLLALFGHGAMSELSPLSGAKQTSRRKAATSVFDPLRKSARGIVRLVVSIPAIHPVPDIRRSSGGSDASRVDTSVRGDVVDLAARSTDIH